MFARGFRSWGVLVGVVVILGGTAAVYARQQAAGSVLPGRFIIINKTSDEAVPVSLAALDPKFPILPVEVVRAPAVDLTENTVLRLTQTMRHTWEYSSVVVTDADPAPRLNTLGRDGWELVSVVPATRGNTYVFKRATR